MFLFGLFFFTGWTNVQSMFEKNEPDLIFWKGHVARNKPSRGFL